MKLIDEFKEFALKGSVVDMAVGLVIGAAFTKVVTSFVSDVLMPPVGLVAGGRSFEDLRVVLKPASAAEKAVTINYGAFLATVLDFLLLALAVFLVVKAINRARSAPPRAAAAPPAAKP